MKKASKKEFVYLVGDCGPEHNEISSIHKTYEGALKSWNKLRLKLLQNAKQGLQYSKDEAKKYLEKGKWDNENKSFSQNTINYFKKIAKNGNEMYIEMIKKLSCENHKKIDNYPHETPYINKEEVEN